MNRIFIDMDGVIVDFDSYAKSLNEPGVDIKSRPGIYLKMNPMPDAIESVRRLIGWGYDVFVATKPPTGISSAYAEKAQWVLNHLPELKRKIIITSDKGLLGDDEDYLIDDRPHKANCKLFKGTFIEFGRGPVGWDWVLNYFNPLNKQ